MISSLIILFIAVTFMAYFLLALLYGGIPENKIANVIIILLSIIIGFGCCFLFKSHEERAIKQWNNGYCQECNVKYDIVGVYKTKNENPTYVYQCPECKKVIETHFHN